MLDSAAAHNVFAAGSESAFLRKLGASDRAEAVSRWVQLERHQRVPGG